MEVVVGTDLLGKLDRLGLVTLVACIRHAARDVCYEVFAGADTLGVGATVADAAGEILVGAVGLGKKGRLASAQPQATATFCAGFDGTTGGKD